jgi:hypothetical protein
VKGIKKTKKKLKTSTFSLLTACNIKRKNWKKKTNKEKEKKSKSTGLTRQIRLTHQTWDLCHESVITK